MKIIRITTMDKKEIDKRKYLSNGEYDLESIPKTYNITFICEMCNREANKRKGSMKNNRLICGSCQREETNLEKYGVKTSTQDKGVLDKRRDNNLKKYGVESPSQLEKTKEKAKQTNLEKYGVKASTQSDYIKEKIKQTNLEKYGKESYTQTDEYKEKAKQTNLEKYGTENPFGSGEIKEKIRQTNLEKYGVKYPGESEEIKEKIRQTNLKKYGVPCYFQNEEFIERNKEENKKKYFENLKVFSYENLIEPQFNEEDYRGIRGEKGCSIEYKWKCKLCNNIFYDNIYAGKIPRCPNCFPSGKSKFELELRDFVSKYFDIEVNDRRVIKPYEIDILIPEKDIGIEFNGLYWHSEVNGKDKYYHLNKQNLANEKGYDLIHVFENEWVNKKEIVKSIILSKLNIYENTVYGRNTEIKKVSKREKRDFLNSNHLQGDIGSSVEYGLYYGDELVSVIIFGKTRFNKNHDWELLRFTNKLNTKVIGGFSKLLNFFLKNHQGSIITYSDKRYFNGYIYQNNGFAFIGHSQPNYFYFRKNSLLLESRNKYQKHKLSYLLNYFNPDLTEYENMLYNGYNRIWDCGNKVYCLHRE